jgi:ArsR family transcriptional regulator
VNELVSLLKVLGDPTRLKLLKFIAAEELCNCELMELLGVSQPAVSQHLTKLKAAKLVKERRQGQWTYYTANQDQLSRFASLWHGFLAADTGSIPELAPEHQHRLAQRQKRRCD